MCRAAGPAGGKPATPSNLGVTSVSGTTPAHSQARVPARRHRTVRRLRFLLAGALVLAVAAPAAFGAASPQPGQKITMKVLLLSADGKEATFGAWKAALTREGVPFEAKIADDEAPFTDSTFADYGANTAKYQAVILATGDLVHPVTVGNQTSFPSALSDSEWTALAKFELTFGRSATARRRRKPTA
jgi:hypothetical protein